MAYNREQFVWRDLALHWARRKVLDLVQDDTHPHLYRIRYPDGWTSTPANISRARDAAYDHARYLLCRQSAPEAAHSPEEVAA